MARLADIYKVQHENMYELRDICFDYSKADLMAILMVPDVTGSMSVGHAPPVGTGGSSKAVTFEDPSDDNEMEQDDEEMEEEGEEEQEEDAMYTEFRKNFRESKFYAGMRKVLNSRHMLFDRLPDLDIAKLL